MIGSQAPDFTLPDDKGNMTTLSAQKGKAVLLYFYPKDDTSGCTKQACAFRDQFPEFSDKNLLVLGVSKDSVVSHGRFRDKYSLNFPLLSDSEGTVCEAYGVWKEKSMYGKKYMGIERTSFLIDAEGIIRHIWPKVKIDGHAEDVLKIFTSL
ncbi:MAG: thioredoxin-dependent thiol peroxidase [Alphaproteobacteria bacterium]